METLLILLKNYQNGWEAFFVGGMQALLFMGIFAIARGIRNAKEKNKKDWDEVSKDETTKSSSEHTTDWEEIKKDNN